MEDMMSRYLNSSCGFNCSLTHANTQHERPAPASFRYFPGLPSSKALQLARWPSLTDPKRRLWTWNDVKTNCKQTRTWFTQLLDLNSWTCTPSFATQQTASEALGYTVAVQKGEMSSKARVWAPTAAEIISTNVSVYRHNRKNTILTSWSDR